MLAQAVLVLTTRACHRSNSNGVVMHRHRHRGEIRRVGTKATTGAARGAVGQHFACAQGHQGSGCGEECRGNWESWSCTSCRRCTQPWERQGTRWEIPDREMLNFANGYVTIVPLSTLIFSPYLLSTRLGTPGLLTEPLGILDRLMPNPCLSFETRLAISMAYPCLFASYGKPLSHGHARTCVAPWHTHYPIPR